MGIKCFLCPHAAATRLCGKCNKLVAFRLATLPPCGGWVLVDGGIGIGYKRDRIAASGPGQVPNPPLWPADMRLTTTTVAHFGWLSQTAPNKRQTAFGFGYGFGFDYQPTPPPPPWNTPLDRSFLTCFVADPPYLAICMCAATLA